MQTKVDNFEKTYRKSEVPTVRSGDTVAVHQRIVEGSKERVQVFEGVVIRTHRKDSLNASLTVRRISGGIGVEKTFMVHSPAIEKIEVLRHSKVRRNYLSYLRERSGKSARLKEVAEKKPEAMLEKVEAEEEAPSKTAKDSKEDKSTE